MGWNRSTSLRKCNCERCSQMPDDRRSCNCQGHCRFYGTGNKTETLCYCTPTPATWRKSVFISLLNLRKKLSQWPLLEAPNNVRPKNCKVSIRCNEIKTKWFDFLVVKAVNLPLAESTMEGGSGGPALLTVKHQCKLVWVDFVLT